MTKGVNVYQKSASGFLCRWPIVSSYDNVADVNTNGFNAAAGAFS